MAVTTGMLGNGFYDCHREDHSMIDPWRSFAVGLVMLGVLAAAAPAHAAGREHMVAMDRETMEKHGSSSKITVRDAIDHQPVTIDFRGKTLNTVKPGDVIEVNDEEQTVTAFDQRAYAPGTTYSIDHDTFAKSADKSEISVQDAVHHQPVTVDFQGKTLRSVKPGDVVEVNGEKHELAEVAADRGSVTHVAEKPLQGEEVRLPPGLGFTIAAILKFKCSRVNCR
ncbi:MAG: hypothetical protein AB7S71_22935 [Dongiaceae bacterium]